MQIKHKKSNAGFSLIELLVVVAIMSLLMGGALISWYAVSSANIKKAISYVDDALTECKNRAMTTSADNWKVVITNDKIEVIKTITDDGGSVSDVVITSEAIPKNVNVYVQQDTVKYDLATEYNSISISYKLLSGEVKDVYANKGGTDIKVYSGTEANYCDIVCQYKERTRTVRLYYTTGKHIQQ